MKAVRCSRRSPSGTSADVALRSSVAPVHAAEVALGRDADPGATAAPVALLLGELISTTS